MACFCGASIGTVHAAKPAPPVALEIATITHHAPIHLLTMGHVPLHGQAEEVLATAADDGTVRTWLFGPGAPLRIFHLPRRCRPALGLLFQGQGHVLVVHGRSGTCAFDTSTGMELQREVLPQEVSSPASPDLLRHLPRSATAALPLPGGRLAFAAGSDFGEVTAAGAVRYARKGSDTPDFSPGSLLVSHSGSQISYELTGGGRWLFSLFDQAATGPALRPGPAAVPGLRSNRRGALQVVSAGRGLRLERPGGRPGLALQAPAEIRDASLSGDGRTLVTALSDGTLRFYAVETGRLLLTVLLHQDDKRWVAWTGSGLYAAATDGDQMVGFRVDHGMERTDFFPFSQFRRHLYRPELLARLVEAPDQARAEFSTLPSIHRLLPPVVTLLSPITGGGARESTVTVRVALRVPSQEPVLAICAKALATVTTRSATCINAPAGKPLTDGEYALTLDVPPEDCRVQVQAETAQAQSAPLMVPVSWNGPQKAPAGPHGTLRLLAIGISRYEAPRLRLNYAAKDAQDVAVAFLKQEGLRYQRVEARVLTDEDAGREAIGAALAWLRRESAPQDTSAIFLAGHGDTDPVSGEYAFLPQDAAPTALGRSGILAPRLKAALWAIQGEVLLFLDTCRAGSAFSPKEEKRDQGLNKLIRDLQEGPRAVIVYSASQPWQVSQEHPAWGNGAFTKALVEGLSGHADTSRTGRITISMLEHYISERVRELTAKTQTSTLARTGTPDLEIARVRWPPVPVFASRISHYEMAEEINQPVLLHREEPGAAAGRPLRYRLVEDLIEIPANLTRDVCQQPTRYAHQLARSVKVHREIQVELKPGERWEAAPLKVRAPGHRMDYLLRARAIFDDPTGPLESAPIYRCLHIRPRRWAVGVLGRGGSALDLAHNNPGGPQFDNETYPAAALGGAVGVDVLFQHRLALDSWRHRLAPRIGVGATLGMTRLDGVYPCRLPTITACVKEDLPALSTVRRRSTSWTAEVRYQMNLDLMQLWRISPRLVVDLGLGLESLKSDPGFSKDGLYPVLLLGYGLELAAHISSPGMIASTIRLGFMYQIRYRLGSAEKSPNGSWTEAPGVPMGLHTFWFVGGGDIALPHGASYR